MYPWTGWGCPGTWSSCSKACRFHCRTICVYCYDVGCSNLFLLVCSCFLFSSTKILLWLKNIVFLTLSLPKVLHWHTRISGGSFQWYCWPRWGFITFEYKACCGCTSKWPCYSFSLIEEKNSAFQSNCWNFIKLTDFTVEQLTCTLNMVIISHAKPEISFISFVKPRLKRLFGLILWTLLPAGCFLSLCTWISYTYSYLNRNFPR